MTKDFSKIWQNIDSYVSVFLNRTIPKEIYDVEAEIKYYRDQINQELYKLSGYIPNINLDINEVMKIYNQTVRYKNSPNYIVSGFCANCRFNQDLLIRKGIYISDIAERFIKCPNCDCITLGIRRNK